MKIFLDDRRKPPVDWVHTKTVRETIKLIKDNPEDIEIISLDNDLGKNQKEGHRVLDWLEEQLHYDVKFIKPFAINIHSANPVAAQRMLKVIDKINKVWYRDFGGIDSYLYLHGKTN